MRSTPGFVCSFSSLMFVVVDSRGNFRFPLDDVDGGDGAKVDAAPVFVELPLRQRLRLPGRRKRTGREDQLPIGPPHVREPRCTFLPEANISNVALDPRLDDCAYS
jgi:hypothetical protein